MTESRAKTIIHKMGYRLLRNEKGQVKPYGSDQWFPSYEAVLEEIEALHAFSSHVFRFRKPTKRKIA